MLLVACREGFKHCEAGGECIEKVLFCDGTPDCRDESDEANCGMCCHQLFICQMHCNLFTYTQHYLLLNGSAACCFPVCYAILPYVCGDFL